MRPAVIFLSIVLLLLLSGACFAVVSPQLQLVQPCVACEAFKNAPQANIFVEEDDATHQLTLKLYYEDLTATPTRKDIGNTALIVEAVNLKTDNKWIYKTYTDADGKAMFDFTEIAPTSSDATCLKMTVLYCPFCKPDDPVCGFAECMKYAGMGTTAGYYFNMPPAMELTSADQIPLATGAVVPSELNTEKYVAQLESVTFCPPPPPLTTTPEMCLPLLIIFSMLSGALYLTGRNPFTGFNIGGARIGKHITYQARGRGFSLAAASAVASLVQTAVGAGKTGAKGAADAKAKGTSATKGAFAALAAQEKQAAQGRFIGGGFVKGAMGARALGSAVRSAPRKGKDGEPLTGTERIQAITRGMEARTSGMGFGGGTGEKTSATRGRGSVRRAHSRRRRAGL